MAGGGGGGGPGLVRAAADQGRFMGRRGDRGGAGGGRGAGVAAGTPDNPLAGRGRRNSGTERDQLRSFCRRARAALLGRSLELPAVAGRPPPTYTPPLTPPPPSLSPLPAPPPPPPPPPLTPL